MKRPAVFHPHVEQLRPLAERERERETQIVVIERSVIQTCMQPPTHTGTLIKGDYELYL